MKKLRLSFALIVLSLLAFSGILFGCADKYANMKIEASEESIVFYYGGTEEQEEEMTKSFDVTVFGAPNDVSKDVRYVLTNDILEQNIKMTKNNEKTTFELTAKKGAGTSADMWIMSVESDNVKAVVHISIVCRVSSISENPDFAQEAFVEVGDRVVTKQIAQTAISFEPSGTNQKNLTYALKQNYDGIQIDGANIVINPQNLPKNITDFEIVATSVDNTAISTTIKYHIIKKFGIKLQLNGEDLPAEILMTTNSQNSDKNSISVDVVAEYLNGSDYILDKYQLEKALFKDPACTISDEDVAKRELVFVQIGDNNQIAINAIKTERQNPYVYLKVWAKIDGYNYKTEAVVAQIKVETVATDVSVDYLGEVRTQSINYSFEDGIEPKLTRIVGSEEVDVTAEATYQIYDNYVGIYGSKFVVSVGRSGDLVADKSFVLYSPDATKFDVFDENGNNLNGYILSSFDSIEQFDHIALPNNSVLYVKALETESKSVLQFVTIDSIKNLQKNVAYTMIFDSTIGASQIEYKNDENSAKIIDNIAYIPVVNIDDTTKVLFQVVGETSSLMVSASSDIVLFGNQKIVENDEAFELIVYQNPRYQNSFGNVIITLKADNNYSQQFTLKVFLKVDSVKAFVSSAVAKNVEYDEKTGSISSFALAKGDAESLRFVAYYGNKVQQATIVSKEYSLSGADILAVSVAGDIIKAFDVGMSVVKIHLGFVDDSDKSENGIRGFDIEIEVFGYLAVKSSKLGVAGETGSRTSFVLYSADTLGQDYVAQVGGEYTTGDAKHNYKKMNLSIVFTDGTQFDGKESDSLKISWTISSSLSTLVTEKVYTDNGVETYCIKNGSKQLFVATRKNSTVFEVFALESLESSYDVFLSVTITQLGKKEVAKSRFVVQKATQIEQIGNLTLKDNSTGATRTITKDALGNIVGSEQAEQVYYVYKPFTQVLGNASQYQIFANIMPNNPLVKDLDFSVSKIEYDKENDVINVLEVTNEVVLTPNVLDCEIKVNMAGTYKLTISSKDSKTESGYNNFVEVYFKFADGSKGAEIEIRTAEEFADMLKVQTAGKYYNIKNNLNLSTVDSELLSSVSLLANINGKNVGEDNKTFNATITGIYLSKHYSKDTVTTENALDGLFATIASGARVENLNLVINQVEITYENVLNAYFGGLAGQNFGTIENVSVQYMSQFATNFAKIVDNSISSYIGGLVGQNCNAINNAHTDGSLKVQNSSEILKNVNRVVGGVVGENLSTITVNDNKDIFFNNSKPQSNYSSTMSIEIADNLVDEYGKNVGDIAIGGVVGKNANTKTVTGVSFAGVLSGQNNVGGIVGINLGTIERAFNEAKIDGKENVGGIAGYSDGNISQCSTIFYSNKNYVAGANNVGGIVGSLCNANIEYCYARSYFDAQQGDIRLKNSTDSCFSGGLAGYASNATISKSYSRAKLFTHNASHNIGGIVGDGYNVAILNAFERNVYNGENNSVVALDFARANNCQTTNFYVAYQNAQYVTKGSQTNVIVPTENNYLNKSTYGTLLDDAWYFMMLNGSETVMVDYPFLKYGEKLLTLEVPTQISVTAIEEQNVSVAGADSFVVWRDGLNVKFADIFRVVLSISNADLSDADIAKLNLVQDYYLTSNNENVAIIGGTIGAYQLELRQEGEVRLTITSKANANLSKTITIFVKNKVEIESIEINNPNQNLFANKPYQLKVDANDVGNANNYYIEISSNANAENVAINGHNIGAGAVTDVIFGTINSIMSLDKFDNVELTFRAYIIYNGQKVYCGEGEKRSISSIYGIKSFDLDTTTASISPNSQLEVIAFATSEDLGNVYSLSYVVKDQEQNDISLQDSPLLINIEKKNHSTTQVEYSILVSINYDKANEYFDKTISIEFTFALDNEKVIYQVKTLRLSLTKLFLQNISADFYKHIEKLENDKYGNASQVSSNSIIAGNLGVMQINLSPAETEVNSIVIYHSQSDEYSMEFTQLVKNGNSFVDIGAYVKTAKNGFGIELFKLSDYAGNFDGNVYAGLVISKAVPQDIPFRIYVEVIYNGGYKKLMPAKILYSEKASELQIVYNFDGEEYNDGDSVFVPLDIKKTVTFVANELFTSANSNEEIARAFSIQINNVLTNLTVDASEVVAYKNVVVINFEMTISKIAENTYKITRLGQEFVVQNNDQINIVAICTRATGGSNRQTKTQNPLTIYPMLFVVKKVNVSVVNENGSYDDIKNSLAIKKGFDTKFVAKLDCEYADIHSAEALSAIAENEDWICRHTEYWKLIDTAGHIADVDIPTIEKSQDNRIVLNVSYVYNAFEFGVYIKLTKNGIAYQTEEYEDNNFDGIKGNGQYISHNFELSVYRDVADTDATPVSNATQLANMKKDNSYRLVPTGLDGYDESVAIVLENHLPIILPENVTFDGNGMTIVIKSLYKGYVGTNYGLFASIGSGSVVKNLTVKYLGDLNPETNQIIPTELNISQSSLLSFTFGGIVAENNGVLYNSSVEGNLKIVLNADITANIGGVLGSNAGYVSYCASNLNLTANNGHVAGFVSTNSKKISASKVFVQNYIENSNDQISQKSSLAGFVARNIGEIDGCYVSGQLTKDEETNKIDTSKSAKLKANAVLAGFAYENQETIKNSYVNILIDAGRAGGFVYSNSGEILSSYTKLELMPAQQNSNQIAPFVGVDELSGAINNSDTIDDCYYYRKNFGSTFAGKQIAKEITDSNKSNFAKFIFANDADDGIWQYDSSNPQLIEANRIIDSKYTTYYGYFEKLPSVDENGQSIDYYDSANQKLDSEPNVYSLAQKIENNNAEYFKYIGSSPLKTYHRYVKTADTEIDQTKVYYYSKNDDGNYQPVVELDVLKISTYYEKIEYFGGNDVTKFELVDEKTTQITSTVWDGLSENFGEQSNPRTIANATDWQQQFAEIDTSDDCFVLLCDVELSDTPITAYNYQFAGKLFANNMSLTKLYINESEIQFAENQNLADIKSMGLFAELDRALIKNLNISTGYNISANDIEKVGILTGYAKNAKIVDVDINATDAMVIGANFVGGVAGVLDRTTVVGASVSTRLNAVYSQSGNSIDLTSELSNFTGLNASAKKYSYSGLLAAVMTGNSIAKLVNISGKNIVIGYYSGLVAGLVDKDAELQFASAEIVQDQFIKGYIVAGGLVGENRGTIVQSQILNADSDAKNLTFFAGNPFFAGGLVGFNNGGTIENCFSAIDVRSAEQQIVNSIYVVGGLVGLDVGGAIECCYVLGSVRGEYILGGLVGAVSRQSALRGDQKVFKNNDDDSYVLETKYSKTADTDIIENKNYYIYDSNTNKFIKVYNPVIQNIDNYYENNALKLKNCFAINQWLSYSNAADDSHYISDTILKGTIFGAFVDEEFGNENDEKLKIYNFIGEFGNVYFSAVDSEYTPNLNDTDSLHGTYTAGKFMRAFGATGGAKVLNFDNVAEPTEDSSKVFVDEKGEYKPYTENNLIKICSIGGTAINFNTTKSEVLTKYNCKDNIEDFEEYNYTDFAEYFANAFVGGALICNGNNDDFEIVYGQNGVYAGWSNEIFNLPNNDANSENYYPSIYPKLIVNINK